MVSVFCHLPKRTEMEYEKEDSYVCIWIRLRISGFKYRKRFRIKNWRKTDEGSGWVLKNIPPMQSEMHKTIFLTSGTYTKLPFENETDINIQNVQMFSALWSILAFSLLQEQIETPELLKENSSKTWKSMALTP